jgi:16S rRNA (cytidine1402-2'-O)-methyltransferase
MMPGTLYIVPTPIGNYDDITVRGLKTLQSVDMVICEEYKEARRLLAALQMTKDLISLNEHNEKDTASEVVGILKEGKNLALISDCGTPLFSDPGTYLINLCIQANIHIIPLPGTSSLMTALSGSGFDFNKFQYYGWLSPKREIRSSELQRLKKIQGLIVLLETPYRLIRLLEDLASTFPKNTRGVLAYELTKSEECYYRGTLEEILDTAKKNNLKGEFVMLVHNK